MQGLFAEDYAEIRAYWICRRTKAESLLKGSSDEKLHVMDHNPTILSNYLVQRLLQNGVTLIQVNCMQMELLKRSHIELEVKSSGCQSKNPE